MSIYPFVLSSFGSTVAILIICRHEFPRPNASEEHEPEDWTDNNQYHTLSLPDSAIVMVDSEESLRQCLHYMNDHECKIVGIDSEWKPAFGAQQNELSLIQLATWDRIFILDVIGMSGLSPDVWNEACSLFFENPQILKLGKCGSVLKIFFLVKLVQYNY